MYIRYLYRSYVKRRSRKIAYKEISIAGFNDWNIGKHGDTEVIDVEEVSDLIKVGTEDKE